MKTMRQIKFFTMALTLLMGLTLTSCLDSDTNPIQQMQLVARYSGSYYGSYFETAYGQKLTPTDPSKLLTLTNGLYNIYFEYNTEEMTDQSNISITLLEDPVKIDDKTCMSSDFEDGQGNAALACLEYSSGYVNITPAFFDKNTMLFPVIFWSITPKDEKAWKDELAKHQFDFTYSFDEGRSNSLIINLTHKVTDMDSESKPERKQMQYTYFALDIRNAVRDALDKYPDLDQVVVKAKCNSGFSDKLENAVEQIVTIDCSKIDFKK